MKVTSKLVCVALILFISCTSKTEPKGEPSSNSDQLVTFNKQISPLINSKCSPCHTSQATGKSYDYSVYSNTKRDINDLISRVISGNMPKNGSRLSQLNIDQIKKWKSDGLK
jgi:hypothetical protein